MTFPTLRAVVLGLLASACVLAVSAQPFRANDRWCAVGDSITHSGPYSRYLYLFYATRFPGMPIDYFNCGISGDTAAGTFKRIDADILRHRPTVATIMLGMNDVNRGLYSGKNQAADLQKQQDDAIARYEANMKLLAGSLHASGVRLIFMTPSIFDQTAVMPAPNMPGVNDALGRCAGIVRSLAAEYGAPVVDFHGPMTVLNSKQQEADPQFTLVGADRIHPKEPGHLVMAYLFLKALGTPQMVADIAFDAKGKTAVFFEFKENALPFPVPPECAPALKLVPFMDELNVERLRVTNLPPGNYGLKIDGEAVATFTASELARGTNLAKLENTPQYLQALAVARLDEQRHDLIKRLRTIDYVERMMGRRIGDESEFDHGAAARKLLGKTGHPWIKSQIEAYLQIKPKQAELKRELAALVEGIRKASQTKPHRFEIAPAPAKGA